MSSAVKELINVKDLGGGDLVLYLQNKNPFINLKILLIMNQEKVDMLMMSWRDKLPEENLAYFKEKLEMLDDKKLGVITMSQPKNPMVSLIISIFLGQLGLDRFYIGDIGLGVGKLLTCGGLGLWWLVDLFLIMGATRQKNYQKIEPLLK